MESIVKMHNIEWEWEGHAGVKYWIFAASISPGYAKGNSKVCHY